MSRAVEGSHQREGAILLETIRQHFRERGGWWKRMIATYEKDGTTLRSATITIMRWRVVGKGRLEFKGPKGEEWTEHPAEYIGMEDIYWEPLEADLSEAPWPAVELSTDNIQ